MEKIHEWLESCLKHLTHHNKFKGATKMNEINTKRLGEDMVVFASDIYRCSIVLDKNGVETKVQVILKSEPDGPTYINMIKQFGFFETESMMYTTTLKEMEQLMIENGDEEDLLWPECYYCQDNKMLLQDLNEVGYRTVSTHSYLDLDHISLVMASIGKFHGMSMVLMENNRLSPKDFKPSLLNRKIPFISNMYTGSITRLAEVIRDHWQEPQWSSAPDRLLNAVDKVGDKLAEMYDQSLTKCGVQVLNHGDFSIKNLLFLYGPDSERPVRVKFVDFQGCHFSTPARDLAMILYTSVMPQLRENNLQHLLKVYCQSLNQTCTRFGYSGKVPNLEEITAAVNSLSYWSAIISLCSLPVFLSADRDDYKLEVEKFLDPSDKDQAKPKGAVSKAFYRIKPIEDALKFEVQRCIDSNIF